METTKDPGTGSLRITDDRISDEVIAICAVNATLKTEGVAGLAGGISNAISKNFLGKELMSKGIKVNQTDEGIEIDVHITVKYHAKIPVVAWDIQENVKREVQSMVEIPVIAVNIHVQGVVMSPDDESADGKEKPKKQTIDVSADESAARTATDGEVFTNDEK